MTILEPAILGQTGFFPFVFLTSDDTSGQTRAVLMIEIPNGYRCNPGANSAPSENDPYEIFRFDIIVDSSKTGGYHFYPLKEVSNNSAEKIKVKVHHGGDTKSVVINLENARRNHVDAANDHHMAPFVYFDSSNVLHLAAAVPVTGSLNLSFEEITSTKIAYVLEVTDNLPATDPAEKYFFRTSIWLNNPSVNEASFAVSHNDNKSKKVIVSTSDGEIGEGGTGTVG